MITRCLKCGKEHPTKDCDIKERQENPYCINCNAYGHTACYTKCPNFPKPRKGSPLVNRNSKKFTSNNVVEGISFANMVSGNKNNNDSPPPIIIIITGRKDKVLPELPPLMKLIPLTSKTL
ncbi:uncharacterized protein TNCV_1885871 [Trichonephila clavipes]|nr:uncharacterized protein TNCV_1885871 [Trichonephila clavipes]